MDSRHKEKQDSPSSGVAHAAMSTFGALVDSPGRRGVRIFGLPRNQLIMAVVAFPLLGMPLAFMVAMAPFWDWVGDLALVAQLNSYVAPAMHELTNEYRSGEAPQFPVKRFLIASTSLVELILLSTFVALFARGVRRHALLVWTCYDRTKLFRYFGISCLAFFSLWYVLFFNWGILAFLFQGAREGIRLFLYVVIAMPFVTFVFGHMAAIIGMGAWRTASRKLRPLHKAFL